MTFSEAMDLVGKKFGGKVPTRIGTRELSRHTTAVLSAIKKAGGPSVITYRGVPSFLIAPIEQDELLTLVLAASPELLRDDISEAELALDRGEIYDLPERSA
jgi:antitoxin (DNA-binding transcriptional repressor) of toxin-antitoxin stability system